MKNLILISVAGAIALVAGLALIVTAQQFGWIAGENKRTAAGNSCEHGLQTAECPFCTPELIESLGWCSGHDVAEALCTRCNRSLVPAFKAVGDWCAEHAVPESQCMICQPDAGAGEVVLVSNSAPSAGENTLRANRPPSSTCLNAFSTVQFKTPEVARRAGLKVEPVRVKTIEETIACTAEIAFDGNRYARLSSRAAGNVAEVMVDLGEHVEKGAVLVLIDSAELGTAKAAFLQARSLVDLWEKNEARERRLLEQNVGTEQEVLEAETRLVESRVQLSSATQRLRNLGLSDEAITEVASSGDTSSLLALHAPFAGIVVDRNAVTGEVISTAQTLFAIADTSSMWVMLDVYENHLASLRVGQAVTLSLDAMPDQMVSGTLAWISADVDPQTRTIRARAEVMNEDGLLRAHMFGRAEVHIQTIENALLVPESAVQWDGCCNLVFVRQTDTIYQPYQVTLGYKDDGHYIVSDGLRPGESVVTEGSFLLKTEILKGNIGAGCCEVDPGASR